MTMFFYKFAFRYCINLKSNTVLSIPERTYLIHSWFYIRLRLMNVSKHYMNTMSRVLFQQEIIFKQSPICINNGICQNDTIGLVCLDICV